MPTLAFDQTAQIATVPAPDTSITIQSVYDQFVRYESRAQVMLYPQAIIGGGKFDYGTGDLTVVSIRLIDWKLAFEARPGPALVGCTVTGGNLSSVDDVGAAQWPIQETAYTSVSFAQATTGALIQADELVDIWTRLFGGRLYVDAVTAEEVIRDALGVVYSQANIWSDDGSTPYDGTLGVVRRDEHVKP
jgi:hypothetical protein